MFGKMARRASQWQKEEEASMPWQCRVLSMAGRDTGTADNSARGVMETDDYRRQGVGTSSRGTSVADGRGAETVGSPLWISQYVRWCIRQAMANASQLRGAPARSTPGTRRRGRYSEDAALIGRCCSGREALPRSLNSAVLPLALFFFFGPCRSPPSLGAAWLDGVRPVDRHVLVF